MSRVQTAVTSVRRSARELWAGGTGWVLLMVGAGWALSIGLRFVFPALLPVVRPAFGIGLSTTGLLLSLLWGAYAAGHVPGGLLGDRLGEGTVLVLSAAVSTAAVLAVALAPTVAVLFAATVTFGLATALYGPTRFTILTDLYPDRSGSAVGLTMAAGNLGNTVLPVAATVIAGALTWRAGFAAFVPLFALVAVGLWATVPARTSGADSAVDDLSRETLTRLREGLAAGAVPVVVAVQVTLSFLIQGFTSFYPSYLIEAKGLGPETAAALFGAFFAVGALVQATAGPLVDRAGMKRALLGFYGACVLALLSLPFVGGLVPLAAVTVAFAAWNGTIVATQTYIAETLPSAMQGTGFGTLKAGWMLVGATAPLLVGVLADAGRFDAAFLLLGGVGGVGVLLTATRLPAGTGTGA